MSKLQIVLLLTTLLGSFHIITGAEKCGSSGCMYEKMLESVEKDFIEQCFKEVGVTAEDIRSAVQQNVYGEKQMCFQKCLAMKTGSLGKDGQININYMKEHLPPDLAPNSEAILACLKKLGPITACQHISGMRKCIHL